MSRNRRHISESVQARVQAAVADKYPMHVNTSFANVPIPEVAALLQRLEAAGWVWEENRHDWNVMFRKDFDDRKSADHAGDEMSDLMKDYADAPPKPPIPEAFR